MQRIKNQILGQISSKEVRAYIENNIFNDDVMKRQQSTQAKNIYTNNEINSSSMLSSFLETHPHQVHRLSIKTLLNRIQKLIVINGFSKTIEDIKESKANTLQLRKQNIQIEKQLYLSKRRQGTSKYTDKSNSKKQKYMAFQINVDSKLKDFLIYDEQLKRGEEKLRFQKMKSKLISIVKLSKQEKQKVLQNTRKQYESIKRHISTLQTVISNIQKFHPEQASLKLQIQQIQTQLDQKSMLIADDSRIDVQIQILQQKIQTIERQNPHPNQNSVDQYSNIQLEKNYSTQKSNLQTKLNKFEQFLKQEQEQKHLLLNEINLFNERFNNEQKINQNLIQKIKNNFYNSPQLIDYLVKTAQNNDSNLQFLFKNIGISFE